MDSAAAFLLHGTDNTNLVNSLTKYKWLHNELPPF